MKPQGVGLFAGFFTLLALALTGKKSEARPPIPNTAYRSNVTANAEREKLAGMINEAVNTSPSSMRVAARNIREFPWAYPENDHEAYLAAADLDARANELDDMRV